MNIQGAAGVVEVLWDPSGQKGTTFALSLGQKTNNKVEAIALYTGLQYLRKQKSHKL